MFKDTPQKFWDSPESPKMPGDTTIPHHPLNGDATLWDAYVQSAELDYGVTDRARRLLDQQIASFSQESSLQGSILQLTYRLGASVAATSAQEQRSQQWEGGAMGGVFRGYALSWPQNDQGHQPELWAYLQPGTDPTVRATSHLAIRVQDIMSGFEHQPDSKLRSGQAFINLYRDFYGLLLEPGEHSQDSMIEATERAADRGFATLVGERIGITFSRQGYRRLAEASMPSQGQESTGSQHDQLYIPSGVELRGRLERPWIMTSSLHGVDRSMPGLTIDASASPLLRPFATTTLEVPPEYIAGFRIIGGNNLN